MFFFGNTLYRVICEERERIIYYSPDKLRLKRRNLELLKLLFQMYDSLKLRFTSLLSILGVLEVFVLSHIVIFIL